MESFITVKEFTDNGGILDGKQIYILKRNSYINAGIFYKGNIAIFENLTFPLEPEIHFVKIKVIPIYA